MRPSPPRSSTKAASRSRTARKHVRPLEIRRQDRSGSWQVDATVAYQGELFSASFSVKPDGEVEMIDDDPLGSLGTLLIPSAPSLHLREQPRRAGEDVQSGAAIRRSDGDVTLSRDRDVTEAVVAVLLEEAIDRLNDAASAPHCSVISIPGHNRVGPSSNWLDC